MSKSAAADTLALPLAERLQLVKDIWDTIASATRKPARPGKKFTPASLAA